MESWTWEQVLKDRARRSVAARVCRLKGCGQPWAETSLQQVPQGRGEPSPSPTGRVGLRFLPQLSAP